MSKLFDDASLAMIPSAYKDGKLYSIRPTDGSGDFTFSRGSNLAATRVNEQGLIEKGRENLLLQSNNFDTTPWIINGTATSGASGYDGSTDAWTMVKASTSSLFFSAPITTSSVCTLSIYIKINPNNGISLVTDLASGYAAFNISDANQSTPISPFGIDAKQEYVGNDFYRLSITTNGASYVRFYNRTADGTAFAPDSATQIIQDAQLEQGLVATEVITTGASTAQAGILEDMPRLDYSGGASCPSILLEPQRSNYFKSSEYLTPIDSDLTQSVSDVNSPISGVPYLKILKSNSGVVRFVQSRSVSGIYTYSVFAKQGSTNGNIVKFSDSYYGSSTLNVSFDLSTGSFVATPSGNGLINSDFEDFGNGSYRIWVTFNHNITSAGTEVRNPAIFLDDSQLDVNEYIYLTGFQFEQGSYPTSYIPTYGSSVTRSYDSMQTGTLDTLTNYSLFVDIKTLKDIGGSSTFIDKKAASSDLGRIFLKNGSDISYYSSSTGYIDNNLNLSDGAQHKYLLRVTNGFIEEFFDGVKQTNTVTNSSDLFNGLELPTNNQQLNLNQLLVFPTALTDSECIALTSL